MVRGGLKGCRKAASPPQEAEKKPEVGGGEESGAEGEGEVGIKYDSDKLRWDLLPLEAVSEIVRVMTFGSRKYGDHNWKKLSDPDARYFAACMRHLSAWQSGEKLDPETGIGHLAHAACNLLFLIWFEKRGDAK